MRGGGSGCAVRVTGLLVLLCRSALMCVPALAAAREQGNLSESQEATRLRGQSNRSASLPKSGEPFEIHGVVIAAGGKPVAEAEVKINVRGLEDKPLAPPTVETDIHGEFRAKLPAQGHSSRSLKIALEASKGGFLDAHDWIEAAPEGGPEPCRTRTAEAC